MMSSSNFLKTVLYLAQIFNNQEERQLCTWQERYNEWKDFDKLDLTMKEQLTLMKDDAATLEDAFSKILEITSLNEETFTYLYISSVDDLEHQYGFDHEIVIKEIKKIEEELKRLNNNADVAIIITADHGQVNVKQDIVMDFAKYDQYFYAYPGVDFGMATYYVKDGKEEEFVNEFNKDFKGRMTLFKTEEFINNKVFGPNTNNTYLLNNLGEYISLCASDGQFINSLDTEKYYGKIKGKHSGLTKGEMIIPLIVITKD